MLPECKHLLLIKYLRGVATHAVEILMRGDVRTSWTTGDGAADILALLLSPIGCPDWRMWDVVS